MDIGDSEALQQALHDRDASVRSRAAESLSYSRDAGFLLSVLQSHPDAQARRRAAQALSQNPGGEKARVQLGGTQILASMRTVGVELFGHFLAALDDHDEGVREQACAAVLNVLQTLRVIPVRETVERIQAVLEDDATPSLVREPAERIMDIIEETSVAEGLATAVSEILQWHAELIRHAAMLRFDAQQGKLVCAAVAGLDTEATANEWRAEFHLNEDETLVLMQALGSSGALPDAVAQKVMRGLARSLCEVADVVYHGSLALVRIGEDGWEETVGNWCEVLQAAPLPAWGESGEGGEFAKDVGRSRARATLAAGHAYAALGGNSVHETARELAGNADDWIRIAAITVECLVGRAADETLDELAALCASRHAEGGYGPVVGPAAALLCEHGRQDAPVWVEAALGNVESPARVETTQRLLLAAQGDETARVLRAYLEGKTLDSVPLMCLAIALRGGGHDIEGLAVPQSLPAEAGLELRCALDALRTMQGDMKAVANLVTMLRAGKAKEKYLSALYLGLARVRSAVPIFDSVTARDVPYALRGFCAGMLVQCGHPGGLRWFNGALGHVKGLAKARLARQMAAAIAQTLALMLKSRNVNLGRFV